MSDIQELTKTIKNWRKQTNTKTITNTLQRIKMLKSTQSKESLQNLINSLKEFKVQANKKSKVNEANVEEHWFHQSKVCWQYLQTLIKKKESRNLGRVIYQNKSAIKIAQNYTPNNLRSQIVEFALLKSFLVNMKQHYVNEEQKIKEFLKEVTSTILKQFNLHDQQKVNMDKKNMTKFMARINQLTLNLQKVSSTISKQEMIEGSIQPGLVAENNVMAFFDEEAKRLRKLRQKNASIPK